MGTEKYLYILHDDKDWYSLSLFVVVVNSQSYGDFPGLLVDEFQNVLIRTTNQPVIYTHWRDSNLYSGKLLVFQRQWQSLQIFQEN
jgi:hypothetical protein